MQRYDCLFGESPIAAHRYANNYSVPGTCGTCVGCKSRRVREVSQYYDTPLAMVDYIDLLTGQRSWVTVDWRIQAVLVGMTLCAISILCGAVGDFGPHTLDDNHRSWIDEVVVPLVKSRLWEAAPPASRQRASGHDSKAQPEVVTITTTATATEPTEDYQAGADAINWFRRVFFDDPTTSEPPKQDEPQGKSQGESQDSSQGRTRGETQGETQDATQDATQDETQDATQDATQDEIQSKTEGTTQGGPIMTKMAKTGIFDPTSNYWDFLFEGKPEQASTTPKKWFARKEQVVSKDQANVSDYKRLADAVWDFVTSEASPSSPATAKQTAGSTNGGTGKVRSSYNHVTDKFIGFLFGRAKQANDSEPKMPRTSGGGAKPASKQTTEEPKEAVKVFIEETTADYNKAAKEFIERVRKEIAKTTVTGDEKLTTIIAGSRTTVIAVGGGAADANDGNGMEPSFLHFSADFANFSADFMAFLYRKADQAGPQDPARAAAQAAAQGAARVASVAGSRSSVHVVTP